MTASRQALNRQRTIRDIETAFLELYREGGMGNVTTSKLCQRCGIARSTFYLYFEDKYAILQGAEDRLLAQMWELCKDLPDVPTQGVSDVGLHILTHIRANMDWYRTLLGDHGDPMFVFRWKKDIVRSLERKLERNGTTPQDTAIAGAIVSHALIGLYTHIVLFYPDIPDEALCRHMDKLLAMIVS